MLFYLIAGAVGTSFVAGATLEQLGWLEPAINAVFGARAESVLLQLQGAEILLTFALALFVPFAAVAALFHLYWYRRDWHVVLPSALILATIGSLGIAYELAPDGGVAPEIAATIALAAYFIAAFVIGLDWILRRRQSTDGIITPQQSPIL